MSNPPVVVQRGGRPREAICQHCGKTFAAKPHRIERGEARFCSHHCAKWHGRPSLTDFFWSQVDRSGDCWLWTGSVNKGNGYGRFTYAQTVYYAHRLSYEIAKGPIPNGLEVLHSCDTPLCVRPDHLSLGSQAANNADRDGKGRVRHGAAHRSAKLTQAQVDAIKAAYAAGGVSMRRLAAAYGISYRSIADLLHGRTWRRPE